VEHCLAFDGSLSIEAAEASAGSRQILPGLRRRLLAGMSAFSCGVGPRRCRDDLVCRLDAPTWNEPDDASGEPSRLPARITGRKPQRREHTVQCRKLGGEDCCSCSSVLRSKARACRVATHDVSARSARTAGRITERAPSRPAWNEEHVPPCGPCEKDSGAGEYA